MFAAFARAEEGSARTMRWAAEACPDQQGKLLYLQHASDERRHAAMFVKRAAELDVAVSLTEADAVDLYRDLGEIGFLAFVTLAEARGLAEFRAYERAVQRVGDSRSAAVFAALYADEARHERYAWERLVALVGSARRARLHVLGAALGETRRALRRQGAALGDALYRVTMGLLYWLVVPLCAWLLRRARGARKLGWEPPP
jgi:hypothetical protein